jgi:hypothetical protein
MKNLTFLLGFFSITFLGFFTSCKNDTQKIGDYRNDLSAESKATITKEIMDVTDSLAATLCRLDFDKAIEFYDSSAEYKSAENGALFPNRDSLYNNMKNIKAASESFRFEWKQRFILPLSLNAASMVGNFSFKANLKDGSVFEGEPMFAGTFVRVNNKWVLIHGNESSKLLSEDK